MFAYDDLFVSLVTNVATLARLHAYTFPIAPTNLLKLHLLRLAHQATLALILTRMSLVEFLTANRRMILRSESD